MNDAVNRESTPSPENAPSEVPEDAREVARGDEAAQARADMESDPTAEGFGVADADCGEVADADFDGVADADSGVYADGASVDADSGACREPSTADYKSGSKSGSKPARTPSTAGSKRKSKPPARAHTGLGRRAKILIVIVLVVVLAAGGVVTYLYFKEKNRGYELYKFDTEAIEGRIQHMTEEEIQAELNRVVEEGMFNISIASAIVFPTPDAEGEARIENIAANRYHMQVDIFLDDTRELVYSSRLIRPGYSVKDIKLEKRLPAGEYSATAIFSAITQQELQLFGTAGAQIKLYVFDGNIYTPAPAPAP